MEDEGDDVYRQNSELHRVMIVSGIGNDQYEIVNPVEVFAHVDPYEVAPVRRPRVLDIPRETAVSLLDQVDLVLQCGLLVEEDVQYLEDEDVDCRKDLGLPPLPSRHAAPGVAAPEAASNNHAAPGVAAPAVASNNHAAPGVAAPAVASNNHAAPAMAAPEAASCSTSQASVVPMPGLLENIGGFCTRVLTSVVLADVFPMSAVVASLPGLWQRVFDLWRKRGNARNKRHMQEVQLLIHACNELTTVLTRSVNLIREGEVLERMTLSGRGGGDTDDGLTADSVNTWRMMTRLREAIVHCSYVGSLEMVFDTRRMIAAVPLISFDSSIHYISTGNNDVEWLLAVDREKPRNLELITRMLNTYILLQSEFLRRMALEFCPTLWYGDTYKSKLDLVYPMINSATGRVRALTTDLSREYRAVAAFGRALEQGQPYREREYNSLHKLVHSFKCQMQSALSSILNMERRFLENPEDEDGLVRLKYCLNSLANDLVNAQTSCQCAVLEVDARLVRYQDDDVPAEPDVVDYPAPTPARAVQVRQPEKEYVPEDEVFEGMRAEERPDGESRGEDAAVFVSAEELARQAHERSVSRAVMQELARALIPRAAEWEEREMVALRKKHGGCDVVLNGSLPPPDVGGILLPEKDVPPPPPMAGMANSFSVPCPPPMAGMANNSTVPCPPPMAGMANSFMVPCPPPMASMANSFTVPCPPPMAGMANNSTVPCPPPMVGMANNSTVPCPPPMAGVANNSSVPCPPPMADMAEDSEASQDESPDVTAATLGPYCSSLQASIARFAALRGGPIEDTFCGSGENLDEDTGDESLFEDPGDGNFTDDFESCAE